VPLNARLHHPFRLNDSVVAPNESPDTGLYFLNLTLASLVLLYFAASPGRAHKEVRRKSRAMQTFSRFRAQRL